jgi:8-oxo-dGTP diphosphatase
LSELPRISVSVKAAVRRGDELLLLSYDDGEFHYNLPGGKAREGEHLRDAVVRKVHEETGLDVTCGRLLFVVELVPDDFAGEFGPVHKTQYNFLAHLVDESAEARLPDVVDPIQVGFEWISLANLTDVYLLPRVTGQLVAALADETGRDALVDRW